MKIHLVNNRFRLVTAFFIILAIAVPALALDPSALPTGGQVVSGRGSISQSGSAMTVTQQTNRLIANWNTFNIGQNASVAFRQPGQSSVALNRIFDQNPSQIYGSLTANGQVFLLNPAGVYFAPTSSVDVGGLVASSLNLSNENFLAGNYSFEKSGPAGSILNQGTIRAADGGYIAFISPRITNEGALSAANGSVVLAAGDKVSLDFTGDGLVSFSIDQGSIDALAENKGLIKADGGTVILTARAADSLTSAVVNNSGIIEANTLENRAGRILLLSDMEKGETVVAGTLDASAPKAGDGGFIETSGAKVTIADDARITTRAANGKTGTWLIDPVDFTIAPSGGDMTGAAVGTGLASSNLEIRSSQGTKGTNGDILINDNITWSANRLTLSAFRNIEINQGFYGSGTAQLSLFYGQGAVAAGNTASYSVKAPVNLPAGPNFSTKLGADGTEKVFTIITSLGSAGSMTGTDLQGMNGNLSRNYALGANINASATSGWNGGFGFNPIGNSTAKYTGSFDGLGHTITGLYIDRPSTDFVGLFGYVSGGNASNAGVLGGSVKGRWCVGSLVGYNYDGTITSSYTTGAVTGSDSVGGLVGSNCAGAIASSYAMGAVFGSDSVGGLVGENYSYATIDNSYATGAVTGSDAVGGLVGNNLYDTIIADSWATGAVTGSRNDVGGLVGYNETGNITNSYATGAVTGASFVGGLVGRNIGDISSSYATGTVTANGDHVGGLVGFTNGTIANSYATGAVTGSENVGGLVGNNRGGTIETSYATGAVTGNELVGGLVGFNFKGTVRTGYATGAVAGGSYVGGLVGSNEDSTIDRIYATGTVRGFDRVGGLVGCNFYDSTITDGYATGAVRGSERVGGLTGLNFGTITDSFATGLVMGSLSVVGGLVGYNSYGGTISASYATGTVIGSENVGGLVGFNSGIIDSSHATAAVTGARCVGGLVGSNSGTIDSSYATGTVMGSEDVGGLVGYNGFRSPITNSYATGGVTGTGRNVGGLVGWNYSGIITSTYATGVVMGNNSVGGLVGYNSGYNGGGIANSYATGPVTGESYVGGLVGENFLSTIDTSYANGAVTGNELVGGLVGKNFHGTIRSCYATGTVTGSEDVGGLAGFNDGSIINSFATGEVTGSKTVGGLVGSNGLGTIRSSYASGAVTGTLDNVGGLVGRNIGDISSSYATGAVMGNGDYVGGLVGDNWRSTITFSYATGAVAGGSYVGGLVGSNIEGTIDRSYSTGTITGDHYVGGLVGRSNGSIADTYATGEVAGAQYVGGLVGYSSDGGTITASHATGSVKGAPISPNGLGRGSQVGGLVGAFYEGGSIIDSYATGTVTGRLTDVGGLVGYFDGAGIITDSYATGTVKGAWGTGGLVGRIDRIEVSSNEGSNIITGSYATGAVTGTYHVGGLVGSFNIGGTVTNCYATGEVTGIGTVGGLVGFNVNGDITSSYAMGEVTGSLQGIGGLVGWNSVGIITNCYAEGEVTGESYVGGLVGYSAGTIAHSYATAAVTGHSWVGGLVGYNKGTIANSYATSVVTGSSYYVGGLVGYSTDGTITGSYATGAVEGTRFAGGLVGSNIYGTIASSYATGGVTGGSYVGGLVGFSDRGGTIADSYATGVLTGASYVGGLVGYNRDSTITNSFWDIDTSGQATSAGGTGKTTAEMKQLATYSSAGWDIDDVGGSGKTWRIYDGYTYPLLRDFLTPATAMVSVAGGTMVYNGTTSVTGGSYTWATDVDTSRIFGAASYTADSKNVGLRNVTLGGIYSNQQGCDIGFTSATVDITKANLLLSTTDVTKTYDGGLTALGVATVVSGSLFGTDTLSGGSFAFTAKNAGTNKTVTASGVTVNDGQSGGNYAVSYADNTTSTITPLALFASYTGTNKIYDGTTSAAVTGSLSTIIGGDTVTLSQSAAFTDKNAGTGKTVNVTGITVGGTDAGNYSLQNTTATTTGDIWKAALSITANDDTRIFSGIPYSGGNGVTYTGFVNGESESVLVGALAYGGTSQGAVYAGNYGIIPSGLTSDNYTIGFINGILTINENTPMHSAISALTSAQNTGNGTLRPDAGSATLHHWLSVTLVNTGSDSDEDER